MDLQLEGRVAIVTGASRGLGWAIAQAYAAEGMARALALAGRAEEAATWRTKAEDLGAAIADDEDRAIFEGDLAVP